MFYNINDYPHWPYYVSSSFILFICWLVSNIFFNWDNISSISKLLDTKSPIFFLAIFLVPRLIGFREKSRPLFHKSVLGTEEAIKFLIPVVHVNYDWKFSLTFNSFFLFSLVITNWCLNKQYFQAIHSFCHPASTVQSS